MVPVSCKLVTPVPPISGLEFVLFKLTTIPFAVIVAPPFAVILPPRVAPDDVAKKLDQTTPGNPQAERNKDLHEKAPPGAKFERMVKHIKKGYSKDGLTAKEKSIAYATAWKAKNREKGE